MAGGYNPQPKNDLEKLTRQVAQQRRDAAAARSAAKARNSSITGGEGLIVQDPNGQAIHLKVCDDQVSRMLFTPPAADQVQDWAAYIAFLPDGSYGGGELVLQSPSAPVARFDNQPAQNAFISLTSGDGVTGVASVGMGTENIAMQLLDPGFGNPGRIVLGAIGTLSAIEEDATSWRMLVGNAGLVFPQTIAEARVRDLTDSAYVPIRASAFTVTSTVEAKQNIRDLGWSPLAVVRKAKARAWNYRATEGDPDRLHVGPMAEDLPAEIVDNTSETPALDLGVLVGVLWGAVQELAAEVAALKKARPAAG